MFLGAKSVSLDSHNALNHLAGSGRFAAWGQVMERYFEPHMLTGSGIGTTQNYFYSSQLKIGAIHSEYIRLLAETGLIGLTLFLLSMGIYFLKIRRNMRNTEHYKSTYLIGACAIFAYLTFMATDNAFDYVNQFGFYIFGLIGVAILFPATLTTALPGDAKA